MVLRKSGGPPEQAEARLRPKPEPFAPPAQVVDSLRGLERDSAALAGDSVERGQAVAMLGLVLHVIQRRNLARDRAERRVIGDVVDSLTANPYVARTRSQPLQILGPGPHTHPLSLADRNTVRESI